jgi:hypothetical protein
MREINIPISEFDLELFKTIVYDNSHFEWEFNINGSDEYVSLNFMSEDEHEQREK